MMKHIPITNLQVSPKLESVYLVKEVENKFKKTGAPFASLLLQDSTGTVSAVMWDNAEPFLNNDIRPGDFILIKASVGKYKEQLQVTIQEVQKVDASLLDVQKFLPTSKRPLEEMKAEILGYVGQVKEPHLHALLEALFLDEKFMELFLRAPAARMMHQAYIGGLAEHTLAVIKNALTIAANYEGIDTDLLLTAALIHDGCKVYEYAYTTAINNTDKGRLVGHISMMGMMLETQAARIQGFPEETKMLLQHIVLSHHGRKEYGSPKVPMTAEAMILFYADYIDAYLSTFFEEKRKAHQKGQKWTEWVQMFESYLYAGEPPKK